MDIIRRNTDYALRLVAAIAENYGKSATSTRKLAKDCVVSYELACKLLQKLSSAKLVTSRMGANGGFELAKNPEKISLYQVIAAVQGDICLNRCVGNAKKCPNGRKCKTRKKLVALQKYIGEHLKNIKLNEIG
ncbi:MAG: Rrf2 family transcriptional regulator [Sedimentisphaerales bacterium]